MVAGSSRPHKSYLLTSAGSQRANLFVMTSREHGGTLASNAVAGWPRGAQPRHLLTTRRSHFNRNRARPRIPAN
eukprot:2705809-Pyramimonas_sp.AAC.1